MGELEDKLNGILSDPEQMEKIMGLARTLSQGMEGGQEPEPQQHNNTTKQPDMSTLFGGLDPKMLGSVARLMGEMNSPNDSGTALLSSIKPYLKKERREKLERAAQLARLSRVARIAMNEMPKGGGKDV